MKKYFFIIIILSGGFCQAQVKILFDATKAEMAGNADWVIDADLNNLGPVSGGAMVAGHGSDSNPQRFPTPLQSNVNASTNETYWQGSLSNWAIDLVKLGYEVESLPYNDSITYGNSGHAQDLSNYNVFIIDEPNIVFTLSQKNALINFVQNGGGLFIICDHDSSDRNGDGYDSPYIWNDLINNNTVHVNPFGFTFDLQNFSETTFNVANLPGDSCLHGSMGNVTEIKYSNGTSITLNTGANNSVQGLIYKTSSSNTGTTGVLFARANFGRGKVCALGDSSPPDDGTGDPNDNLFFSYTGEANGCHQKLLVNSTIWLATNNNSNIINELPIGILSFNIFQDPANENVTVKFFLQKPLNLTFEVCDLSGRLILHNENKSFLAGFNSEEIFLPAKGFYFIRMISSDGSFSRLVIME